MRIGSIKDGPTHPLLSWRITAMLTLTDSARAELDAYFEGKEKAPIRVYLASGGCSGPHLALALDQPNDEDSTFDSNGYSFLVNKELLAEGKNFTIEFSAMGFAVLSELQLGGGGCSPSCCSGCGGGCGTDS